MEEGAVSQRMCDTTKACSSPYLILYCAQKETHIFNVAISNELFD